MYSIHKSCCGPFLVGYSTHGNQKVFSYKKSWLCLRRTVHGILSPGCQMGETGIQDKILNVEVPLEVERIT